MAGDTKLPSRGICTSSPKLCMDKRVCVSSQPWLPYGMLVLGSESHRVVPNYGSSQLDVVLMAVGTELHSREICTTGTRSCIDSMACLSFYAWLPFGMIVLVSKSQRIIPHYGSFP